LSETNRNIRVIEAPLLGTGWGNLGTRPAGRALIGGFSKTGNRDARLYIFVVDTERKQVLDRILKPTIVERAWNAVQLRLGWGGVGIDFKKLFEKGSGA
jgi:hypothetical protein